MKELRKNICRYSRGGPRAYYESCNALFNRLTTLKHLKLNFTGIKNLQPLETIVNLNSIDLGQNEITEISFSRKAHQSHVDKFGKK